MPTLIPSSENSPTTSPPCRVSPGPRDAVRPPPPPPPPPLPLARASSASSGPELLLPPFLVLLLLLVVLRPPLTVMVLVVLLVVLLVWLLPLLLLLLVVLAPFGRGGGSRMGAACRAETTLSRRSSAWRLWSSRCDSTVGTCSHRFGVGSEQETARGSERPGARARGGGKQMPKKQNLIEAYHTDIALYMRL